MNKNKTIAAAFTLALLSACSSDPLTWSREGTSQDQARRDQIACEQQARLRAPTFGVPTSRGIDAGTGTGVGDALTNAERNTGATRDCMRDKGYMLR